MKKLRCGVIGLGMGQSHVKGYQSHPDAEVVAVADIDAGRLKAAGDKLDVRGRYTDPLEMLRKEKLDMVSVATPNKFHKPLTIAAIKAGCHVLCEKPMALNAAEAEAMLDAARQAKRRIMINFSYRFTEQAYALKEQVDQGLLGDIYFARTVWHRRQCLRSISGWFCRKELSGGGPLLDLGVHRLDLALWMMGYPKPVWVMGSIYDRLASRHAKEHNVHNDVEDLAVGLIRFTNGATLELEASWAVHQKETDFMETRLCGTEGGLIQHLVAEPRTVSERNAGAGFVFEGEIHFERDGCQYDLKLHPPVPAVTSPYYHFIDSIINNRPHIATGEDGLAVMKLIDAIYESAEKGRPVEIRN